jgi:SAM-dependent methyltransferase
MVTRRLDVGIDMVSEVYAGPGGILWEMLMGEEIHVGGGHETEVLARKAGITAATSVLDVCSALGGPARHLARAFGCRVTGLDATPKMHDEAVRRTTVAGLDGRVTFALGNALDFPTELPPSTWCGDRTRGATSRTRNG